MPNKSIAYYFSFLLALLSSLSLAHETEHASDIVVHDGWSPAAPSVIKVRAGYFALTNNSQQPQTLIDISSPEFAAITIHKTVMQNGMTSMDAIESVTIAPNATVIFAPEGLHLMMMMPSEEIISGDLQRIPLTLEFASGKSYTTELNIVKQESTSPSVNHADHHPS